MKTKTAKRVPVYSLDLLKGIGAPRIEALRAAGFSTLRDLLFYLPKGHLDRATVTPIAQLAEGEHTIRAKVRTLTVPRFRRRVAIAQAVLEDDSGKVGALWFGRYDVKKRLAPGVELLLSGRVGHAKKGGLQFHNPDFEEIGGEAEGIATGGIIPVYPPIPGVGQNTLRRAMKQALEVSAGVVKEYLPPDAAKGTALPQALHDIHFAADTATLSRALPRWIFEEFFLYELAMALRRRAATRERGAGKIDVPPDVDRRIRARLPFSLTAAQERAVSEIRADLASGRPMNRLLQGDVGSGKTAVAFATMLAAVAAGGQAALLVPTETLAEQHCRTIDGWLKGSRTECVLLSGSLKAAARREALSQLADGSAHIAVGTHALIQPDVAFSNLFLAVVDEQHRFGVLQRAALAAKGERPHVLVMTATPIPRTLAITAFGDLDVTTLDELPPGRTPVTTRVVAAADLQPVWEDVRREIAAGRQAFLVYPLVDASDRIAAKSAIEMHEHLARDVFPDLAVGLLHGRLKTEEKVAAMDAFRANRTKILVSTVVIEVGVDVPNATVMIVGNAERFGLATLHQLRGRIGRSTHASTCILAAGDAGGDAMKRLRILEETQDGFRIAEEDLRMRGPGEFLGARQSGAPEFHLADLVRDAGVLVQARDSAFDLISRDPDLRRHPDLRKHLLARLGAKMGLAEIL
ncbi:MAG: ATP-dependent DNA helicase [Planctomycetota bacterium]|nr:MAG: ATP-dependent DNA helicase [Planctomycetota bacterium]